MTYLDVEGKIGHIHPAESLETFRRIPHSRAIIDRYDGDVIFADGLQLLYGVLDSKSGTPHLVRVGTNGVNSVIVRRIPGDVLIDPFHLKPTVAHQLLLYRVEVDNGHEVEGDGDYSRGSKILYGTHPGV